MTHSPLVRDILNQPASLGRVIERQFGEGKTELLKAATLIREARAVILCAMGSSLYACYPLRDLLNAHGVPACVADASEMLHYRNKGYRDGVCVLVSRSGESIEVIRLIPLLRARGNKIVGVTHEPESELARGADVTIVLGGESDQLVAVQTYTATLAVLYLLGAAASGGEENASRRRDLDQVIGALGSVLDRDMQSADFWVDFMGDVEVIHLLGRGPSMASAHEGALLLNEIAKLPSVSMSAGMFRHGPVEVVDANFRGVIFAPEGPTRALNLALAEALGAAGARICVIGPPEDGKHLSDAFWRPIPSALAELAPILEIAPLQIAACRLAERRGIALGAFRMAPHITKSETSFDA